MPTLAEKFMIKIISISILFIIWGCNAPSVRYQSLVGGKDHIIAEKPYRFWVKRFTQRYVIEIEDPIGDITRYKPGEYLIVDKGPMSIDNPVGTIVIDRSRSVISLMFENKPMSDINGVYKIIF